MEDINKKTKKKIIMEDVFPKKYIQHGLNATKAYKEIKPNVTDETARTEASRVLAIPNVQKSVREELEKSGLTADHLDNELKKITDIDVDSKHVPSKLGAIKEANEMLNRKPRETKDSTQLHLHAHFNVDKELAELDD